MAENPADSAIHPALDTSSERLLSILNHIPTPFLAAKLDTHHRGILVNEQFIQTFGYTLQDVPTVREWALVAYPDPDYRHAHFALLSALIDKVLNKSGTAEPLETRVVCKDGTVRDVLQSLNAFEDMLLVSFVDITERKKTEDRLRISEQRHRILADNANDVVWTMDFTGSITYVSPSVERVRGFTPAEAMSQTIDQIHTPPSQELNIRYLTQLQEDLAADRPLQNFRGELEYLCKDGSTFWTEVMAYPLLNPDGVTGEILGVTRDITARKRYALALEQAHRQLEIANAELTELATTDSLTKTWNRRHFEQAAISEMSRSFRTSEPLSLILFDLDHFKAINDFHGHLKGDQVLIEVVQIVRNGLRVSDLLARWGGEEFVALLPRCNETDASRLAQKLCTVLANHEFPGVGIVTASFGVAQMRSGESLDTWISRTDDALYRAKTSGRNAVALSS